MRFLILDNQIRSYQVYNVCKLSSVWSGHMPHP